MLFRSKAPRVRLLTRGALVVKNVNYQENNQPGINENPENLVFPFSYTQPNPDETIALVLPSEILSSENYTPSHFPGSEHSEHPCIPPPSAFAISIMTAKQAASFLYSHRVSLTHASMCLCVLLSSLATSFLDPTLRNYPSTSESGNTKFLIPPAHIPEESLIVRFGHCSQAALHALSLGDWSSLYLHDGVIDLGGVTLKGVGVAAEIGFASEQEIQRAVEIGKSYTNQNLRAT